MPISISVVLLAGWFLGEICRKIGLPALVGMLLAGIVVGPGALNLLDGSLLAVSTDLRRIALIIILIRAGLKLELSDLKKVGRPAVLMCFLPACLEVASMALLAPGLLGLSLLDSCILGAVIGAVSPAVVVPAMIRLIDGGYGTEKGIPQMILAGASVDDVFVIVLFSTFTGLARGEQVSVMAFAGVPVSILCGIAGGAVCGWGLLLLFRKLSLSMPVQTILLLAVSFILNWVEGAQSFVPFAGLIAVMAAGSMMRKKDPSFARGLSGVFDRLWVPAEIFLFVLVGASVETGSLRNAGLSAVILILGVLLFRMAGVFLCTVKTGLTLKERLFCMLAYTPKATVQAAIGGLPLAMGLPCGSIVLTVSVVAILLTAPLGAFAIEYSHKKLLARSSLPS